MAQDCLKKKNVQSCSPHSVLLGRKVIPACAGWELPLLHLGCFSYRKWATLGLFSLESWANLFRGLYLGVDVKFLHLLWVSVCETIFYMLLYHFGVSHSVSILFWDPGHSVASIWKWRWNLGALPGLILCMWDHTFVVCMCVSTCTGQLRCLWWIVQLMCDDALSWALPVVQHCLAFSLLD